MPPTNSSGQVARQDPKYRSLAEMSNYRHRSIPANNATPMDRTCRKNGQYIIDVCPGWSSTASCSKGSAHAADNEKRYKDALKANLTMLDINPAHLESLTADRTSWRALCRQSIGSFEDSRVSHAEIKRRLRKTGHASTSTSSTVQCDVCRRTCGSRIGLFSHKRTHLWSEIRRVDGPVHLQWLSSKQTTWRSSMLLR